MLYRSIPWVCACGDLRVAMSERFVEILDFPYFYEHFLFQKNSQNGLEKQLENEIRVRVGIELVTVDM